MQNLYLVYQKDLRNGFHKTEAESQVKVKYVIKLNKKINPFLKCANNQVRKA